MLCLLEAAVLLVYLVVAKMVRDKFIEKTSVDTTPRSVEPGGQNDTSRQPRTDNRQQTGRRLVLSWCDKIRPTRNEAPISEVGVPGRSR